MIPVPESSQMIAVQALEAALGDILVSTDMPTSRPGRHIVLSRIGGGQASFATNDPRFLVEIYAATELDAERLAEKVQWTWKRLRTHGIRAGVSDNNLAPYPSPDTDHVRWQFTGSLKIKL